MTVTRAKLSVNVNKVATLRNSRGGTIPNVIEAVRVCVAAGVPGITVHPRADARHITMADVREISAELAALGKGTEFNIEGDPRPDLLAIVHEVRPTQCTLVPVKPGEVTSQAGWPPETPLDNMRRVVGDLQQRGSRVSMFVDPEPEPIRWAASLGADRIELYTEPFARAFAESLESGQRTFQQYALAASLAHELGRRFECAVRRAPALARSIRCPTRDHPDRRWRDAERNVVRAVEPPGARGDPRSHVSAIATGLGRRGVSTRGCRNWRADVRSPRARRIGWRGRQGSRRNGAGCEGREAISGHAHRRDTGPYRHRRCFAGRESRSARRVPSRSSYNLGGFTLRNCPG